MTSFPRLSELPLCVDTDGWSWEVFKAPTAPSNGFWLGVDRDGNRWLTKRTGDFYAYREIIFARLAQSMNWSCQSTVFMRVDEASARVIGVAPESIHAAHWLLPEHVRHPCGEVCAFSPLVGRTIRHVEDIQDLEIAHIMDWAKSDLAVCLFGANEPSDQLITTSHELVIIDSEQMFSTKPESFECTTWWGDKDQPRPSGVALAKEVCRNFVDLGETKLQQVLELPAGVTVTERHPIAPLLRASYEYARFFVFAQQ